MKLSPILRSGNSFYGIIGTADERAADLIVIATRGYTVVKRVLLGSTTERVVRHAPCLVLTVPARTTPRRTEKIPPLELKKILVPIDFSKTSEAALSWAALLAAESRAELILLHVVEKFPIVDEQECLAGVVRIRDAIRVAETEATEDMQLMVGLSGEERIWTPWKQSIRSRLPWLAVNLGTALGAATVVSLFEGTISRWTALVAFLPLICAVGRQCRKSSTHSNHPQPRPR